MLCIPLELHLTDFLLLPMASLLPPLSFFFFPSHPHKSVKSQVTGSYSLVPRPAFSIASGKHFEYHMNIRWTSRISKLTNTRIECCSNFKSGEDYLVSETATPSDIHLMREVCQLRYFESPYFSFCELQARLGGPRSSLSMPILCMRQWIFNHYKIFP